MSIYKFLYSCAVLALASSLAKGQGRIAEVLQGTADLRSAAMGHSNMGLTRQMPLYSNPGAMLTGGQRFSLDLSSEWFPDSEIGRVRQYNVSLGYRPSQHIALYGGWRRLSGLTLPTTTGQAGMEQIKPYGQSFDLGLALVVARGLTLHSSAAIFTDYVGTTARGVALTVGASYQRRIDISPEMPSLLSVGIRLQDAGRPVQYDGTKLPHSLPTSLVLGVEWGVQLAPVHQLSYAFSSRIYTADAGGREYHIGTGLEYCYRHSLSARLGYRYARQGADMLTFGLGYELSARYRLDVAYNHAPAQHGVDRLYVGVGFSF